MYLQSVISCYSTMSDTTLFDLPVELLSLIISNYLNRYDLARLCMTCKHLWYMHDDLRKSLSSTDIISTEDKIISFRCSPDGNLVAVASPYTIIIYSAKNGYLLKKLVNRIDYFITSITFSVDGKHIICGINDILCATLSIWDVESGQQSNGFKGNANTINTIATSPDGVHVVSGSRDGIVRIWSLVSCQQVQCLEGHTRPVNSVVYSADGKRIASGSCDKSVIIWDAIDGKMLLRLIDHTSSVLSVAFSPDCKYVASGGDDYFVRIWDAGNGKQLKRLTYGYRFFYSIVFSPDGKRIAGSISRGRCIWDTVSGQLVQTFTVHQDDNYDVAFSSNSKRFISCSRDTTVRIWHLKDGIYV